MALAQTDIKKVLAYSTISQLGYMFLALGVGAFSAGIFHLMTHAFFKALLFLGAGSVIHALSGEQDLRKMGGLWNTVPATSRPFLIATLAIAGMPPLAGFFSKDEILGHTFARAATVDRYLLLWIVGLVTAGLTAFYMFRLLFLAFFGLSRVSPEVEHHIHESPKTMTVPLMILAALSIVGGWFALPTLWGEESSFEKFLEPVRPRRHSGNRRRKIRSSHLARRMASHGHLLLASRPSASGWPTNSTSSIRNFTPKSPRPGRVCTIF